MSDDDLMPVYLLLCGIAIVAFTFWCLGLTQGYYAGAGRYPWPLWIILRRGA